MAKAKGEGHCATLLFAMSRTVLVCFFTSICTPTKSTSEQNVTINYKVKGQGHSQNELKSPYIHNRPS